MRGFIVYLLIGNVILDGNCQALFLSNKCLDEPNKTMIKRDVESKIIELAQKMPVIGIVGPSQSGKTMLVQRIFKSHIYISFQDLKIREFASKDPHAFFALYKDEAGIILDEIQEVPDLLSYVQVYADKYKRSGYFVITGTQSFLVFEAINKKLAGRIALFNLLPLSISELRDAQLLPMFAHETVFRGQYPQLYKEKLNSTEWYSQYICNYIEHDMLGNADITSFKKFMGLCAGRIGQLLNLESLAIDAGISIETVKTWLAVLENDCLIFLLQPYSAKVGKILVKTPKLYFYDTGLACALLRIESAEQLLTHYLRSGLFENLIIAELYKQRYNIGRMPYFYFWRDKSGKEVDCIMTAADKVIPIEIKASMTISQSYFTSLEYLYDVLAMEEKNGYVVYAGEDKQSRTLGMVISWKMVDKIVKG